MKQGKAGRHSKSVAWKEVREAELKREEAGMRRDLLKREAARNRALEKFRAVEPPSLAKPVPKRPIESRSTVSNERQPQIDALNDHLKRSSDKFYRFLDNAIELNRGVGSKKHAGESTRSSVEITFTEDARLAASEDSVHLGAGTLTFKPGGDHQFGRGRARLPTLIRDRDFRIKVAVSLNRIISRAAAATGYPASDFEGLRPVFVWATVAKVTVPIRVVETRRVVNTQSQPIHDDTSGLPQVTGLLNWEILPKGWWHGARSVMLRGDLARARRIDDPERIALIDSLVPRAWYAGYSLGTRHYFVAEFKHIAIADCPDWGNALYYYSGPADWRMVFRRSKRTALSLGAKRILHNGDWKSRLLSLVRTTNGT